MELALSDIDDNFAYVFEGSFYDVENYFPPERLVLDEEKAGKVQEAVDIVSQYIGLLEEIYGEC